MSVPWSGQNWDNSCLHGSFVDEHSVEILGGFGSQARFIERDVCDATTLTILVVLQRDFLDLANRFGEVFLFVQK